MAKKINIAVVGLGFMGVTHLRCYQKISRARIVAVCDPVRLPENGVLGGVNGNIQKSSALVLGPGVKSYTDFSTLLADPAVHVVDLCSPTALHPEQAIAALKAGKHVLCEKPLAKNSGDAKKVLAALATTKKILMPAMCMRFWPGWAELKKIVAEKTYGKVLAANFRRLSAKPAWGSNGVHAGGALYDLHIHDTDFVNFLFGRPESVFSNGVQDKAGNIDHVVTQYFFPRGPMVCAEGSWLAATGFNMAFTLHCERATIDFDFARGAAALQISQAGKKIRTVKLAAGDGYAAELKYFIDCLASGKKPAIVSAQDGLMALEICEAEETSVRSGTRVRL